MKKILSYIMLSAIMVTFLPYSALAETTNVGVKITGSTSIEVVTTISADITVDLTTGTTTPTYMEIQNNSLVPVSAKITNISTTSEGAPSTFVKASDKEWNNLNKEDTKKYVNFNIIGEGESIIAKDILPNTEIDLGTVGAKGTTSEDFGRKFDIKYYEINANLGSNWDEGENNFTYQIETVYSKVDSYVDQTERFYGSVYQMRPFTYCESSGCGIQLDIYFIDDESYMLLINEDITFMINGKKINVGSPEEGEMTCTGAGDPPCKVSYRYNNLNVDENTYLKTTFSSEGIYRTYITKGK